MDPTWQSYAVFGVLIILAVVAIADTWDKS